MNFHIFFSGFVPFAQITHVRNGQNIVAKYKNKPGFAKAWNFMKNFMMTNGLTLDWMELDCDRLSVVPSTRKKLLERHRRSARMK